MNSLRIGLALVLAVISAPAWAERLTFDHRLQPRLRDVLDSGDTGKIAYDASNPRYVVDRITVRGTSASDWSEQLEVIARSPAKGMRKADDWRDEIARAAQARCPATVFTELKRDDISITFARQAEKSCPDAAPSSLYRVVAGKRSLFLLAIHEKGELSAEDRAAWLAMLDSARLQ